MLMVIHTDKYYNWIITSASLFVTTMDVITEGTVSQVIIFTSAGVLLVATCKWVIDQSLHFMASILNFKFAKVNRNQWVSGLRNNFLSTWNIAIVTLLLTKYLWHSILLCVMVRTIASYDELFCSYKLLINAWYLWVFGVILWHYFRMQADSEIALVGGNSTQNVYISKGQLQNHTWIYDSVLMMWGAKPMFILWKCLIIFQWNVYYWIKFSLVLTWFTTAPKFVKIVLSKFTCNYLNLM